MLKETIWELGKRAYRQSITPYHKEPLSEEILIVGLDTEYYEENNHNELVSWQISTEKEKGEIFFSDLTADAIIQKLNSSSQDIKTIILATFFITAEAQFFLGDSWKVNEYKGKYSFETEVCGKKLIVVDVGTWFPGMSLAKVCPIFNLKKIEYDIVEKMKEYKDKRSKIGKRKADNWISKDKDFTNYAINDAVVVGEILRQIRRFLLSDYGIDAIVEKTPAACSSAVFRKEYVTEEIKQRDWSLRTQALKSSWGGRVECFFRGTKEMVWEYDAHAHHPSGCIALGILPREQDWIRTTKIEDCLNSVSGVYHVLFCFPSDCLYPCLPVVSKTSLIFPLEGESDCTGSEIKLALDMKAEINIIHGWFYQKGTDIIVKYFQHLDKKREQAKNEAESELLKLLMNSVVGKLFQKNRGVDLQKVRIYAKAHGVPEKVAMEILRGEAKFTTVGSLFYPEWYSLILGYARASIGRLAWKESALMISSDSIILDHSLEKLEYEGIRFKLQNSGNYIAYRGKLYRIASKLAHHAVHSKETAQLILESFLEQPEYSYTTRHIVKLREAYRRQLVFGSTIGQSMTVSLNYDYKRKLLPDGTTTPWMNREEREDFLAVPKEIVE